MMIGREKSIMVGREEKGFILPFIFVVLIIALIVALTSYESLTRKVSSMVIGNEKTDMNVEVENLFLAVEERLDTIASNKSDCRQSEGTCHLSNNELKRIIEAAKKDDSGVTLRAELRYLGFREIDGQNGHYRVRCDRDRNVCRYDAAAQNDGVDLRIPNLLLVTTVAIGPNGIPSILEGGFLHYPHFEDGSNTP